MYQFGVSGTVIWLTHILMGSFFAYVGYLTLNNIKIPQILSLVLINLGVLAVLYHAHIWFFKSHRKIEASIHDHSKHNHINNKNKKIIASFEGKKYDLTEWNKLHPGGPILDMVNGKDLKKAWKDNGVSWHLKNKNVKNVLKKYEIK
jgi:hypothetical protein